MRAEFDDSLVTGNEMIDGQHRELIEKINNLLDSCETSKDKLVAVKTLDYLADYTEFHFGEEEKLQESINYPGVNEHKKEHDKLVEKKRKIEAKIRAEEERKRRIERMSRMKQDILSFIQRIQPFLGIEIKDEDIVIRPLESVTQFYQEGKAMHHCV